MTGANAYFAALHWSGPGPTRKSPYVRVRSAIRHITDISSWLRGPVRKFVSNKHHTANSAPRFAHQVTRFHVCRIALDRRAERLTFVFD